MFNSSNATYNRTAIAAEKLKPAEVTQKNKVDLLTNFWEIQVQHHTVYRYDVLCYAFMTNGQQRLLSGGANGDGPRIERHKICLAVLRLALQTEADFSSDVGTVYDCAEQLYTSRRLEVAENPTSTFAVTVERAHLPREIQEMIRWDNLERFEIQITPNMEMPSFDIGDFENEASRDMNGNEKIVSNFLNLLTSQSARMKGLTVFGTGKIFNMNKPPDSSRNGQEQRHGMDKGIKFIEAKSGNWKNEQMSIVPALLLDTKCGTFFTSQCVIDSLKNITGTNFDWKWIDKSRKDGRVTDQRWVAANKYLKGLRFFASYNMKDYTISGISEKPIRDISFINSASKRNDYVLDHLEAIAGKSVARSCNPMLPAIVVRIVDKKKNVSVFHFAMETVILMPYQRVNRTKIDAKPTPMKPQERWMRINRMLEELNLEEGGSRNMILKLFGVSLSTKPKTVTGIRREAPKVIYHSNKQVQLDNEKCNWNSRGARFVLSGSIKYCWVLTAKENLRIASSAAKAMDQKCRQLGVKVEQWKVQSIDDVPGQTVHQKIFKFCEVTSHSKDFGRHSFVIFIDEKTTKSHGTLKLAEVQFNIGTQHLTLEKAMNLEKQSKTCDNVVKKFNVKLGGLNYRICPESYAQNLWLGNDGLLIISYDVAHPGKVDTNELVTQPSVVGFAFNGGEHKEAFVGDYHFQYPKREKVDSAILNRRIKWMVDTYRKNRNGMYPTKLLIIRDGVSEGQYDMVMNEELEAIKEGCREYGNTKDKPDWCPPVAVVIATKRHSARLFKGDPNNPKRVSNVDPLTVVDRDITRPNMNEAYIVSAYALLGTAKPVCYQILVNEILKDMDEFESLMIALTFHHQISDCPISLPEPVYQADEWAKRGNNLWKAFDEFYTLPMKKDTTPREVDFESVTNILALWNRKFNGKRINA